VKRRLEGWCKIATSLGIESSVAGYSLDKMELSAGTEEPTLLEAIARKRLLNTLRAEKN
jgi:hypothetical protein